MFPSNINGMNVTSDAWMPSGTGKRKRDEFDQGSDDFDYDIDVDDLDLDDLDLDKIAMIVDQADAVEELDSVSMKRLLVAFERAVQENQKMRGKYPNNPERFVDSEVDLDDAIKSLNTIATAHHLYPEFLRLNAHDTLLELLDHFNTDIVIDVIKLLQELTETEEEEENLENLELLIGCMINSSAIELLFGKAGQLNDQVIEEKEAIFNIFQIIDNMIEIDITVCNYIAGNKKVLSWLLERLKKDGFDEIKSYVSELLSVILQNVEESSQQIVELNGIEILLICISKYKKKNPPTIEEEEYVENLFNCLCIVSVIEEHKKYFTEAEGLNLMQILVKNKRFTRKSALKVINYMLAEDKEYCLKFIELPGLGTLFTAFMQKGADKHKKGYSDNDDEHIISTIVHLLNNTEENPKLFTRVVNKFREKDFEKLVHLMELHEKYAIKVKNSDLAIEREMGKFQREGIEIDEDIEEEFFLQRLDAGLFTLQKIDYTIVLLMNAHPTLREKVNELAEKQNTSFQEIKKYLIEYATSLGDANEEKSEIEKLRVIRLLDTF
eukprot:TRINITY_DN8564_c0_g1_i1.p1 TRINITY_DN8564_c0_g1~~TRINITY_DN8564_c0_g1_i1.p1  ORF type:complete len:552 (-),score=170.65 TRINITY_DN8564_c0_g1_i1:21-1676(-)